MSPHMSVMYSAIVQLMDACVKEVRKSNKIDTTDLTLEQVGQGREGRGGGEEIPNSLEHLQRWCMHFEGTSACMPGRAARSGPPHLASPAQGLFKSFDEIIRRQLNPIWHTVGPRTKQARHA